MKKLFFLLVIFVLPSFVFTQDINKTLEDRLKAEPIGSAISVVVVNKNGAKFYNIGTVSKEANAKAVDKDTVYEIGSITKVFTGILLAEAIKRGEVKLNDPISKYLPKTVKSPTFNGNEITLFDLTTHGSSLPRMPANFAPKDSLNPYADYSVEQMFSSLNEIKLDREIGSKFDYSNLGVGLLGYILAQEAKMSYEDLVKARILKPLGMKNSAITFTPSMRANLAMGHNDYGQQTSNWDLLTLAGAGALRSTASDMAKFLLANLGLKKTKISDSLAEALKMRKTYDTPPFKLGFNWITTKSGDKDIVWHNGGTGGYRTYAGIDQEQKKGVFVATNGVSNIDDIGFHILNNEVPLRKIEKPKTAITLNEETLEQYVGEYEIAPNISILITREKNQLYGQLTNQPRVELLAEKEDVFFVKGIKADVIFTKDNDGKVIGLVLNQNDIKTPGKKVK